MTEQLPPPPPEDPERRAARRALVRGLALFALVETAVFLAILFALWLHFRAK